MNIKKPLQSKTVIKKRPLIVKVKRHRPLPNSLDMYLLNKIEKMPKAKEEFYDKNSYHDIIMTNGGYNTYKSLSCLKECIMLHNRLARVTGALEIKVGVINEY